MIRLSALVLLFLVSTGCAAGTKTSPTFQHSPNEQGCASFYDIKEALDRNDETIDYDTLLWIHEKMTQNKPAIPRLGELLSALIQKTNDNRRVDSMVLILAAQTIRNSKTAIEGVYGLFETILTMDHRLNSWVLYYLGDAIGNYPYDIPKGDRLADLLELKVSQHTAGALLAKESFGYHFMPPPKGEYIPKYIASIEDQLIRVLERNSYYNLIYNKWTEAQIEKALKKLQTKGIPGTGEKTSRPLKYLILHSDQFQDLNESTGWNNIP